ncbi:hypothetical protein MOT23_000684 [Salmonella enterica]|nr:hypothetical protein [Salmonella enterica]
MKKLLFAIFIILPLGGCTVHGNKSLTDENHQTVKLKIVKGKTTQREILAAFGNLRHALRMMDRRCGTTQV